MIVGLLAQVATEGIVPDRMEPTIIVLTGFSSLAGALLLLFNVIDRMSGKTKDRAIQQPLRVVTDPQVMTKAEHVEHCGYMERRVVALESRTDRIEHKMEKDKSEIIDAGEHRAIHIHNRINDIDRTVSALDERTLTTNSTLTVQGTKLDRIMERLKA